jgi:hypothetical protein
VIVSFLARTPAGAPGENRHAGGMSKLWARSAATIVTLDPHQNQQQ